MSLGYPILSSFRDGEVGEKANEERLGQLSSNEVAAGSILHVG